MTAAAPAMVLRSEPGKNISAVLAAAVHVGLAMFLIYGINWQTVATEAVEVELVRAAPAPQVVAEAKPEPVPEPVQKTEPMDIKPDIALKDKKDRKKPESKVEPRPQESDSRLQKLLMSESAQYSQQQAADRLDRELGPARANRAALAWAEKIRAKIRGNIVRPGNVSGNPEAVYEIRLLPDGGVIGDPRLKKSTGNPALDEAIERAILKSSPLPKPDDPAAFQRVLELKFRPMED